MLVDATMFVFELSLPWFVMDALDSAARAALAAVGRAKRDETEARVFVAAACVVGSTPVGDGSEVERGGKEFSPSSAVVSFCSCILIEMPNLTKMLTKPRTNLRPYTPC